jgi:hypothetical protein
MSVDSTSSLTEVQAQYDDNASYFEDNSIAKAKLFVTACRILLRRTASQMVKGSNQVNLNVPLIEKQLKDAEEWLLARDTAFRPGPSVTRSDFRRFRGNV